MTSLRYQYNNILPAGFANNTTKQLSRFISVSFTQFSFYYELASCLSWNASVAINDNVMYIYLQMCYHVHLIIH